MKENDPHPGHYIIAPLDDLKARFPSYPGTDVRLAVDGRAIYEVRLTSAEHSELEADPKFAVLSHADVLEMLTTEPTAWGTEADGAKEYSEAELSGKTKAQLVEIAEAKGVSGSGSKADIVAAILKGDA